jgi:hypothetical protein
MGEVYRAHDTRLGRTVAIKILPPDFTADPDRVERFDREARVLASLNHPNIASIYGFEETDGLRAIVLELVDGPTLSDRIARGPMPVAEALPIARQIAEAIETAHEQGIIHRDLKPANVKLTTSGIAKVLDFGLAKVAAAPDGSTMAHTEAGVIVGTAGYMSPEQGRGAAVDKRTDVWAFGCVLYEMLTGISPFRGASWMETLTAIATREPDYSKLPADVPPAVQQLIVRCLQKDPQVRLRDMGEARIVLDLSASVRVSPLKTPMSVPHRGLWIVSAVAVVAVVVAAVLVWRGPAVGPPAERLEFTIGPPEGVVWGELPEDPWPSLSPDGRHLVFAARSAAGVYSLWIRDVASLETHVLPDTQDVPRAAWPFWSPDSRTVAYCDGTRIKKIDIAGRPPEAIPANCSWRGGSWNSAGQIVYSNARQSGLSRISSNGGAEVPVTTGATASARQWYPRWLPDGRRFIYSAIGEPGATGIFAASLDGGPGKRLVPDASASQYVEVGGRGYLFFVRKSTLLVQPLDAASFAPFGEPVVLGGQVAMGIAKGPSMAVSPSLLVYRSGGAFVDSELVWLSRNGVRSGRPYGDNTPITDIGLSHDGATMAFGRYNRETYLTDVWTADSLHGTEQPFSASAGLVSNPIFSPDDRTVALTDALVPRLVPVGSAKAPAMASSPGLVPTDWSTDGGTLFASSGNYTMYAIPVGRPGPTVALPHGGLHPHLSRDGHWLAYTSFDTGTPQVVVERYPEGVPRQRVSTNGGFQPHWRGDGQELFYLTKDGDMMSVSIRAGLRIDAGGPTRLFRDRFQPDGANFVRADYAVMSDGQKFLVRLMKSDPKPLTAVRNWVEGLKKP